MSTFEHPWRRWLTGYCDDCGRAGVAVTGKPPGAKCGRCWKLMIWRGRALYAVRARRKFWHDVGEAYANWEVGVGTYPEPLQAAYEAAYPRKHAMAGRNGSH